MYFSSTVASKSNTLKYSRLSVNMLSFFSQVDISKEDLVAQTRAKDRTREAAAVVQQQKNRGTKDSTTTRPKDGGGRTQTGPGPAGPAGRTQPGPRPAGGQAWQRGTRGQTDRTGRTGRTGEGQTQHRHTAGPTVKPSRHAGPGAATLRLSQQQVSATASSQGYSRLMNSNSTVQWR